MRGLCLILCLWFGNLASSQDIEIDQLITEIKELKTNSLQKYNYTMRLAKAYRPFPYSDEFERNGMPKDHFIIAQEALQWATSQKDSLKIAKARRFLIDYHIYARNTLEFIRLASQMVNEDNFASLQDKHFIYLKLGEAYKEAGFIKEYIEIIPEMYRVRRKLKLISSHAHDESNDIAMAYYGLKNYNIARSYFRKSLETLRKSKRPFAQASVSNNIGLSFTKEQQLDSAYYYFKSALDILKEASAVNEGFGKSNDGTYDEHFKNIINANIAYLEVIKGNYNFAINAIKKELESAKIVKEQTTEIQALKKLGDIYYKKREYSKALEYVTEAEKKLANRNDNALNLEVWDIKAKILLALNNQLEADKLFLKKEKLRDSIASIETKKTARVASVLYEVKKKDLEIENQKSNIALLDAKNKVNRQLFIFGIFLLVIFFIFIFLLKSRNTARNRQKLQESFTQDLINAQENERSRLALELHDSVGQQLTMLTRKTKTQEDKTLTHLATQTLNNLREISRNLHPNAIRQLGFSVALENLINHLDKNTDIFFTQEIENVDALVDKNTALHIYRLLQEILTNVVKHSGAKSVEVNLNKVKEGLSLSITDTGIGFDYEKKLKTTQSLGLLSINERSKILGAQLKVNSKFDKGTTYKIVIPLKN